ncbi:MAG TPA: hypothetical protein VFV68_03520 [Agriterribacter sp.]|nr:hypothetical protein [Agriterribacter sp.]
MQATTDYAFASGGVLSRMIDRSGIRHKSMRYKILLLTGLVLVCWLPLAALSFIELGAQQFYLLFIRDIATHVRFLLAIPLLLLARKFVNKSFNQLVDTLYETKIVDDNNVAAFEKTIQWVLKWRNAIIVDILLLVLVYYGFYIRESTKVNNQTFYAPWAIKNDSISIAGWWYVLFSLPVLQMIVYRWFYTICLWIIFLRKISKINLNLSSLHPDGAGGLGFLRYAQLSFLPVAFAFSSVIAAGLNNIIIFSKVSIYDFKMNIIAILLFTLLIFVLPLMIFIPLLSVVKRKYYLWYSRQAWVCARQYEKEVNDFVQHGGEKNDASWHIDLIGSFEKTDSMNPLLINRTVLLAFVSVVLIPFLPVIAQEIPLKELFMSLVSKFVG